MSKICPNCLTEFNDSHGFCSECGSKLVDKQKLDSALILGDANAISGGVNINQSKNVTSHDTHYHTTTIQERTKSESELKLDATNQLRAKAEEIMSERGRIDSVAMSQLRPLATQLGIDDETFKSIIKDVRSNRNGSSSGLSAANARYLQQAQQAVQTNDMDGLSNLTPRLEAMAAISQDDNVQYLYYLSLSILYPIKSMEVYERQTDENYWRTFWAIISYIRTGKHAEATKVLALFDPLRYEKSEDDQNLLEAYFNIMKEDRDGAQEFLDEILGEPTEQVKPLLRAVESTLYEEEADSLEVRFYMERIMSKSDVVVKSQKKVDTSTSPEIPAKETPKQEVKQTPKPAEEEKPVAQEKESNKEAEELYTKACTASGPKRVMLLQKAAEAGSLEAMYDLSDCYADGEGVDKNMPLAIKWVTKAADAGYVKAQAALGGAYFEGMEGLDQNYALSEKYFLLAAQKDNSEAQAALSLLYIEMEEYEKAMLWARKAAQMEQSMAFLALGRIYDEGLGVNVDHKEGLKWFEKAADKGDANAQNVVGNIYLNADYIDHNPSKAFKYYQMAAAQGHLDGMANLGYCYQEGIGTDMNIMSAEEWLRKAAEGGSQDAIDILNENPLYTVQQVEDNKPLTEDEAKALYDAVDSGSNPNKLADLKKAIELGDVWGMFYYAKLYDVSNSVERNLGLAVKWYQKAAEIGNVKAMYNLGNCYFYGNGVKQDYNEAVKWYRKAADAGNVYGISGLAWCYEFGNGVEKSVSKALQLYKKSIENGHEKDEWIIERMNACNIQVQSKEKKQTVPKESQSKKKSQEKETKEDIIIDNVHFSTDGRKNLSLEFECEYNRDFDQYGVDITTYADDRILPTSCFYYGMGVQKYNGRYVSKLQKREKFECQIPDSNLHLKTNEINNKSILIEARKLDERWDGSQDVRIFPLIASYKTTLKLYYEFHVFGKNVLEIRK
jgi:TPR repeat protein